jgi:hypothetical protein
MQTPIVLSNTHGLTFKTDLTQIEYYGIYAYVTEAFNHGIEQHNLSEETYTTDEVEHMFGFAPSEGAITCTNHVFWPGFEHLGPVDYFTLSENHILCAAFITEDNHRVDFTYLRLN